MRFPRLVCVLFAALGICHQPAEADVLGHLLAAADPQSGGTPPTGQAGGTPPPAQPGDLSAWAGEARATTLPDLLQTAVRQAPALASARIDVAIAEAQIQQTWERHDWTVAAQLDVIRTTAATQGTTTTIGGSVDLSRLLPTGGTVALHADTRHSKTTGATFTLADGTPMNLPDAESWTDNISASITQPLLRNRGRDLYDATERRLSLARDASVLATRLVAINTVQAVISAYWDLVLAERGVAITRASLDLARERLRVTQIGADGGKIPRSEIPAVLQIIATREEDVLNGELTVLDRSIALRRAAGMPIGAGELGLRVATDLDSKDDPLDLGKLVERAYAASPQLAQLAKQDASASIDVEVAENGLLPELNAALSLGPTGYSARTGTSDASFGDSWSDLAEFNAISINGTLTFRQSIGRDLAKGQIRVARENRRKLTVNAADVRAQLAQGMTTAVAQLELARRRVVLSQRAIDLANENIKIETDRFNLGKSTNFDVLNRQEDLRQAELRKTQALIDGHKAETVVQALTGDILPSYGITMP